MLLALATAGGVRAQEALIEPPSSPPPVESIASPAAEPGQEVVTEVRIVGNDTVPTVKIESQITTRAGRPFDTAVINRDVRRLANVGWFVDVKPKSVKTPQGRIVIFEVTERPTIRYVEYIGNNRYSDKTMGKQTLLKVGGSVDPQSVQEGRRKIREYYQGKGYNNVQVTVLEGNKPTDKGVVYLINEGAAQKVGKVKFVGNEFVSAGRLRKAVVKSKPPILKIFKGYVDLEKIQGDVDLLTAYYRSYGFFDARVGRRIDFDEENKWATITFVVHEGIRYNVRNVRFVGNSKFDETAMVEQAKVQDGQPFEQYKMNETADWLQELYGSRGYVFADIKPETVQLEEPGNVDLVYHIDEGKQWRVGRIFVHIGGDNPHTRVQTALNRVTLRPGEIMDIRELKASERRLQASSLYAVDAATGQKPKITYKIPDEFDMAAAGGEFRGQSDTRVEPWPAVPVLAPPSMAEQFASHPASAPPRPARSDEAEMHVYCDDFEHYLRWVEAEQSLVEDSRVSVAGHFAPVTQDPSPSPAAEPRRADANDGRDVPAIPARQPQSTPNSTAPTTPLPPAATEPIFRGQSPEPTPNSNLFWTRPRTVDSAGVPVAQQSQAPPQQLPPQGAPQPAGPAYSQFTSPANYGRQGYAEPAAESNWGNAAPSPWNAQAANPYLQVRGQSPAAGQPAYSQLAGPPAAAPPAYSNVYGGQAVKPTNPAAAPINDPNVQPAQFSSQIQPPAGPIVPTPQSEFGPLPGYILLPNGQYGAVNQPYSDSVDIFVDANETQTGRLQMGVGVNSNSGVVGNFVIQESNFDWRRWPKSFEDIRNGTALRGDGQTFRIEASPGSQIDRYLVSFTEPYFMDRPIILGLSGSLFDRQYRDWFEQRIGGRVSLGYQWTERDLSASLTYRGESVDISRVSNPTLQDFIDVTQHGNALHGFGLTVINDTRDSAFLPTQGYYAQLSGEQILGTFDYPRIIGDFRKYWLLSERPDHSGRQVLSLATTLGYSGTQTPIYERFYAGGFATLRGFNFRGASPVRNNVQVGGDFQWLNTAQYLFPLTADDMLHGVLFCDFGTVEESVEINDFRVAPGFGLRITVPAMGPAPIALDFAWPVHKAAFDDLQVFSFSVGFTR